MRYTNLSQQARVLTEQWVGQSIYCPNCGEGPVSHFENGLPVADFYCANCSEEYELKSKKDSFSQKIVDGAYRTMLERLQSSNNPNFFLLSYELRTLTVRDFLVIPKHFFIPSIIEKRKALAITARRAGWVGCNILLQSIPQSGKIYFIKDGKTERKKKVLDDWQKTMFLRDEKKSEAKGWLLDTMRCIEKIGKQRFYLDDVYKFESELSKLHPENRHTKDKIRQQLQVLRDRGYLDFVDRGQYRLV